MIVYCIILAVTDPVCGVVQYSNDFNRMGAFNISRLCGIIESGPDPLASYIAAFKAVKEFEGDTKCVTSTWNKALHDLEETSAGRSWTWQGTLFLCVL